MTTTPDVTPDAPSADPKPTNPDPAAATDPKPDDAALGDPGKAAIAAERKRAAAAEKTAKELAARLKEFEDRDKSETDKATERATAAERDLAVTGSDLKRLRAAVDRDVPKHLLKFIQGDDDDAISASIEEVLTAFAATKQTGPRPDPSQGQQGVPTAPGVLAAAALAAGNTREAIRIKSEQLIRK